MRWSILTTEDGSPTLKPTQTGHALPVQAMHSLQGALSETLHVYGPLADALASHRVAQKAVVVGLGLGYIESLLAATALCTSWTPHSLVSFESETELSDAFISALALTGAHPADEQSPLEEPHPPHTLPALCADVQHRVAKAMGVDTAPLRSLLLRWHEEGRFLILGSLNEEALAEVSQKRALEGFGALFFDAYSAEASRELWTPPFLNALLSLAAPRAGVSTYAAKGDLVRAARAHGFVRERRYGYGAKRECTLAFR